MRERLKSEEASRELKRRGSMDKEGGRNDDSACARVISMCVFDEEGYRHLKHSTAAQLTRL